MKNGYFPEIDGLRFYTFLLILLNHTGILKMVEGHTFFFTLSGFLICHTSLKQINRDSSFAIGRFILNRVLRTFPLYFLIILLCGLLYLVLFKLGIKMSLNNYWSFFVFLQNYFGYGNIFILANLWAMAVTEQLYFTWGLLCLWLQQKVIKFVPVLIILMFILIVILNKLIVIQYPNTLNYIIAFLLGGYCSILYHIKNSTYNYITRLSNKRSVFFFTIGLLICIYGFRLSINSGVYFYRIVLLAFGFSLIIVSLCYTDVPIKRVFNNRIARYLGKISYGLYCYHAIVYTAATQYLIFKRVNLSGISLFMITLIITILISIISYECFEKWFIEKKNSTQQTKRLKFI